MVRSKFPGKPSKIVNRKIVNSSKYTLQQENESTKAAENISYGLAVFNDVFGGNNQVLTSFHGFSPHEVNAAQSVAKKQWEKVLVEYSSMKVVHKPEDAIPIRLDPPTPEALSLMEENLKLVDPVGKRTTRAQCHSSLHGNSSNYSRAFSPSKYFTSFKGNIKKQVANRLLQRAKRSSLDGPSVNRKFVLPSHSIRSSRVIKPNKRFLDAEENEKELPSQMTHTDLPLKSRTIELKKPRLILDSSSEFHSIKSCDSRSNSSKISFSPLVGTVSLAQPVIPTEGKKQWKHVKLADLNVFGAPTTQLTYSSCSKSLINEENEVPQQQAIIGSKSSPLLPPKSKLILRESKLRFRALSRKPKKGLINKTISTPIECEVCGVVRIPRITKQANKFGINSCEACRKFVARMIIKARSSENSVSCEKGQGNCALTASSKNESITTKIHKCLACWLLMCIQRFVSMPEQTRDSLIRMLPANMQGMTVIVPTNSTCSKASASQKKKTQTTAANHSTRKLTAGPCQSSSNQKRQSQTSVCRMRRKAALVSLSNNLHHVREKAATLSSTSQAVTKRKASIYSSKLEGSGTQKQNRIKKTATLSKIAEKSGRKAGNKGLKKGKDGFLRQKQTLKGPRVKHVCRSASVVLGQPMATFPVKGLSSSDSSPSSNVRSDSVLLPENDVSNDLSKCKSSTESREVKNRSEPTKLVPIISEENSKNMNPNHLIPSLSSTSETEKKISLKASSASVSHPASGRRISSSVFGPGVLRGHRRTLQALGVYNTHIDCTPEVVSLDFWESYDPDEVCNSGFGLIGFEAFKFKPVCFLCGSAGKQKLIHCASCCEPYHQFCVEMGVVGNPLPPDFSAALGRNEWRVDWVCPRCTVCHGCGHSTGHQLTSCQRCHNSYHVECLGSSSLRKNTGDRLWICSFCLRCKSCNSAFVTKFVGNLPFCKVCFKLRQKGNFCPLCQGCYTDDDYQSKMMECAECKAWVHAKCEGLSDEKYQVLSYLPESVEYVCRLCCAFPPAPWWLAVEAELQAGYINILKAITKNRKACAMLKWSPKKTCNCQQNSVLSSSKSCISLGKRRLSFNYKDKEVEIRIPPPTLFRISHVDVCTNQCNKGKVRSSVFEFDDDIDAGENAPITKYVNSRDKCKAENTVSEYSLLQLECGNEGNDHAAKSSQYSPNAGSQSDSGIGSTDDELKACSAAEEEDIDEKTISTHITSNGCVCSIQEVKKPAPSLLTVKKKVHSNEYSSLLEFHQDMDQLIREADSHEVKEWYHQTLQEVFPWFDPK